MAWNPLPQFPLVILAISDQITVKIRPNGFSPKLISDLLFSVGVQSNRLHFYVMDNDDEAFVS